MARAYGYVFQAASLFPWRTVERNVALPLEIMGYTRAEQRERVARTLAMVELAGFEQKYPWQLSGGMQQRVAIARALAMDPEILLMDEPFGALDELTRAEMQSELLRIWDARKKTVIFITHSIFEAIYLSDRVVVLSPHPGRVRKEFVIDLPRPRQRSSTKFMEYYEDIHNNIF